ncbi:MAG: hypothetical protein U0930_07565 [Pirellulales bacterium]
MAQSIVEQIAFLERQATISSMGLDAALVSKNYHLGAHNCRDGTSIRLMRALILWRLGENPSMALTECLRFHECATLALSEYSEFGLSDSSIELVGFVASLLGSNLRPIDTKGFESDRLLDVVLINSLCGHVLSENDWSVGIEQLTKIGSKLAVESYQKYRLLHESSSEDADGIFVSLEDCFKKRRKDSFFAGGVQIEGGGGENDLVVDFRLSAIAKSKCIKRESIHEWRW